MNKTAIVNSRPVRAIEPLARHGTIIAISYEAASVVGLLPGWVVYPSAISAVCLLAITAVINTVRKPTRPLINHLTGVTITLILVAMLATCLISFVLVMALTSSIWLAVAVGTVSVCTVGQVFKWALSQ